MSDYVKVKSVRLRGKISSDGKFWKEPKPDNLGIGDAVLTLSKKGRKDYLVSFEPVIYDIPPAPGNPPNSTGVNRINDKFGVFYGFEPKPSNDKFKTTDDFITNFIEGLNVNIKSSGFGNPAWVKSFTKYYSGLTQSGTQSLPPFYEVVQPTFDPAVVPSHPEGYFDIWNKWVEDNLKPKPEKPITTEPVFVDSKLKGDFKFNVEKKDTFVIVGPTSGSYSVTGDLKIITEPADWVFDDNTNPEDLDPEYSEDIFARDEELKEVYNTYLTQISEGQNISAEEKTEIAKEIVKYKPGKASTTPPPEVIKAMKDYGITSPLEQAHFLAQCAHESGKFQWKREFATGKAYEGRSDLGNNKPGDGVRYKGRGYIQITGKANYTEYNKYLVSKGKNDDVVANPELLEGKFAADCSVWFWSVAGPKGVKNFPKKAKEGATEAVVTKISRWVNGGDNGLADRKEKFAYYWSVLEKNGTAYS
jgi:putative chitinase